MNIKEKIKNLFSGQETGFKVVGNNWFARYSNAFEDREGEYFPIKAIDKYIARVDSGVTPAPELWVWHTPIVIGKALKIARIGNFAVAAGYFHETPVGQAAKHYLSTHKAKLSHGFMFEPEAFKDHAYHDYNTFEISILPFNKGVEANAYTNFEVKDMTTLSDEKRAFFADLFGDETAKQLIDDTVKASKAIEDSGVRFKDFTDIAALKEDTPDKKKPMNDDEDEDEDKMDDEKSYSLNHLVAEMVGDIAEIAEGQNIIAKAFQTWQQNNKDLKALFEEAKTESAKAVKALEDENKRLRDELALTPERASKSQATELSEDAKEAFADNLKEKESGEKGDPFWMGTKTGDSAS